MKKKKLIIPFVVLMIILTLAACAKSSTTTTTSGTDTAGNPLTMNTGTRLALGTLNLEGTDLAVTAEQAAGLLPLWKAVRSMGSSDTASSEEIDALYEQIQESMTADQMAAINSMNLTQEQISSLMQKFGITGFGGNMPTPDANTLATLQASGMGNMPGNPGERPSGSDNDSPPSMPQGGGGNFSPPGGNDGTFPGGGFGDGGMGMQGTPSANTTPRVDRGNRMNSMFLEPLIKLLQERSSS